MQRSIRSALLNTQLDTAVEQFSHHTHPVAEIRVKSGLYLQCAYGCYKNLQKP